MALAVLNPVFAATVGLIVRGVVDHRACRAGPLIVRVHVVDEDGETAEA